MIKKTLGNRISNEKADNFILLDSLSIIKIKSNNK